MWFAGMHEMGSAGIGSALWERDLQEIYRMRCFLLGLGLMVSEVRNSCC